MLEKKNIPEGSLHFGRENVPSHLNQCLLHPLPYLPSPSACSLPYDHRRDTPETKKQQIKSKNRRPGKRQFFSHKMCLILISTIRLFPSSWCLRCRSSEKPNQEFLIFSSAFFLMCKLTGCSWSRDVIVEPFSLPFLRFFLP